MPLQPEESAEKMLAGLNAGRKRANARKQSDAAPVVMAVRRALDLDTLSGKPAWGRHARIAKSLKGRISVNVRGKYRDRISPQHVGRILRRLEYP